ncbi:MAG: ParB N-terminal domain-containing protein [Pseudophaeobacter sp. bin_em_oilr2.035]|uniref:ParB/RepB/Spo0J family partition protein n=1 Tax=Phaeobacter gallaeciensis TaxID=60890 RepID=UPI00237FA257|nr:ParB N-terminal domain-containing protein [Phaeobacter gallaeciensis]MDE4063323.1 ParB N-terminal domain-containing protein [Phaeobacter gallaeciensis]MDE4126345.1 ParB N-terminal domain-containing protein [Phaeobacter gallaeciensis]MDE4130820.1 ParB N-terminal domain-containing protein [Phaeobacter gallaeciensis]MDF1773348.1 ParB N-terminal domain-containing protein [Pseudophaeobacter sp. bin_em_oilr2.035]
MAKRKRLMPAQSSYLSGAPESKSALGGPMAVGAAPIAQVASETASQAALQELSDVLENARNKGLMIEEVPLSAIDETHLVRDRIEQDAEEMDALVESLRARGQQTPVELVPLEPRPDGRSHGLISGWRRLGALRRLYAETSDPKYATVKALIIRPETAQDAYIAMVEENEIRVNLSHYERARIAVRAMKEEVFPTLKKALQSLFANVPRAKRSKIRSFVTLVEELDAVLFYPTAISEKLGLSLVRAMGEDEGFAERLRAALQAAPRDSAVEELEILNRVLAETQDGSEANTTKADTSLKTALETQTATPEAPARPRVRTPGGASDAEGSERISVQAAAGVRLGFTPGQNRIELTGDAVDAELMTALQDWLKHR